MTWAETLHEDDAEREKAAREFTLRTIRRGADPINHWIVRTAYTEESISLEELEGELGLARSTLSERVNDLVQVGLLERSVEGDAVKPTVLTAGFLGVVDDVTERFAAKIEEGLDVEP